jgi:hypothetical protein
MPETVLERHYRDRLLSVERMTVHEKGHAALAGRTFEDLVVLCLELSFAGQQLRERESKQIFKKPDLTVAWLQERRQAIEELAAKYLEIVTSLKAMAGPVTDSAGGEDLIGQLDHEVQQFVAAKQSVLERWPVASPQEVAQARAAGQPEDYLDLDEAFAQIAGADMASNRVAYLTSTM